MSSASDWVANYAVPALSVGLRLLVVEGEPNVSRDAKVYMNWLRRLAPAGTIADDVILVQGAGSKTRLLEVLKYLRDEAGNPLTVFGLRDRDEWSDPQIAQATQDLPQLRVNSQRHCLENYFLSPDDIRAVLDMLNVPKAAPCHTALKAAVRTGLPDWVAHWSLWSTLERLKNSMSEAAYPNAFHKGLTVPSDSEIKTKLTEWATMISTDQVLSDYRALKKASLRLSPANQLHGCVYGKNVFPQVFLRELNKLNVEIESGEWIPKLAEHWPDVPTDIAAILQPMLV